MEASGQNSTKQRMEVHVSSNSPTIHPLDFNPFFNTLLTIVSKAPRHQTRGMCDVTESLMKKGDNLHQGRLQGSVRTPLELLAKAAVRHYESWILTMISQRFKASFEKSFCQTCAIPTNSRGIKSARTF